MSSYDVTRPKWVNPEGEPQQTQQSAEPFLLAWINFNPNMDK